MPVKNIKFCSCFGGLLTRFIRATLFPRTVRVFGQIYLSYLHELPNIFRSVVFYIESELCLSIFGMCGVIILVHCLPSVCTVIFLVYIFEFIKATFDSNNFLTDFFCSSFILLCMGSMPAIFWYVSSDTSGGMLPSLYPRFCVFTHRASLWTSISLLPPLAPRNFLLCCVLY